MNEQVPLVSIGLAVFNGEKFLAQAIQSILAQTFRDFELVISDNASTDSTEAICRRFAALDPRIRYQRNASNIGGARNENLTFTLSRGRYFRWAAHDDVCAPDLLARCVEVLERDPGVVLCYTQVVSIDEAGQRLGLTSRNNAASRHAVARFAAIARSKDFCEETYGLIRADVLRTTRLQQNYTASDRTLLCELSLHGRFHEVKEPLFFKRFHAGNVYHDWRTRMAWFGDEYEGRIVFPFWIQLLDYLETIRRVRISPWQKVGCYAFMGEWVVRNSLKLAKDLGVAAYMAAHSARWRRQRYAEGKNWA